MRPNHASRAVAKTVVGQGTSSSRTNSSALRVPPPNRPLEVTRKPREADQSSSATLPVPCTAVSVEHSVGHGADDLDALENETQLLLREFAVERAEVTALSDTLQALFQQHALDEYVQSLERRTQTIENMDVSSIHWPIGNVEKVRSRYTKGEFMSSPEFSAGGTDGFRFHFYPRGDDFCEEGFCSLYLRLPEDTRVERTLFLGQKRYGPDEADSSLNCGVSEMCVLSNEIDKTGSVVIGVDGLKILSSLQAATRRTKLQLLSV